MYKFLKLAILMLVILPVVAQQKTLTPAPAAEAKHAAAADPAIYYAATITAEDLSRHLHIIASDSFEGRLTGERGQKMAAEYISHYFKKYGLQGPVNDTGYYQVFDLVKTGWDEVFITANNKRFEFLDDFFTFNNASSKGTFNYNDIVFAGYGIETGQYNDYKNLDVTGKIVLVLAGEPVNKNGFSYITDSRDRSPWSHSTNRKVRTARDKGARAIFIVTPDFENYINAYGHYIHSESYAFPDGKKAQNPSFSSIFISASMADAILAAKKESIAKIETRIGKKGIPYTFNITTPVTVKVTQKSERISTENVLGFIEGTDKKDEVIVITAHYDHEGIKDGEIYNGADDDGSGTVALIEIAEAFAKAKREGHGPRRSILIMPVTAEEKGLFGSEYYSDNPIFPLENTVANLNIDMIGRVDKKNEDDPNYVYIIGSDFLSTELHEVSERVNSTYTNIRFDYTYNSINEPNRFYFRSDHYNFAKHGIPVIFYFNGTHEDYHKPTDTVEKINFEILQNRTRLIFHTAWELANMENRITVDKSR